MWMSIMVPIVCNIIFGFGCLKEDYIIPETECLYAKTLTVIVIISIPVAFLNPTIILSYMNKNRVNCLNSIRVLVIPKISSNSVAPAPITIEMLTLEQRSDITEQTANSADDNVTISSGLVTMILVSAGACGFIKVVKTLGISFTRITEVYSLGLLSTNFISIYWLLANEQLREFAMWVTQRVLQLWLH